MGLKLHLGCGNRRIPGFVNVDCRPDVLPDKVANIDQLPYGDNSATMIYACHVLEHVPRPQTQAVLNEWHRVLEPQGVLRLAVPDLAAIAKLYVEQGVTLVRLRGLLMGRQNYPENTHYTVWDYELLAHVLSECGYYNIRRWDANGWHLLPLGTYARGTINETPISLNVEATAQ